MEYPVLISRNELVRSAKADELKINNNPPPELEQNLVRLAWDLLGVRNLFNVPLRISSGYRCPAVNTAVGGAKNSMHMFALAADFNVDGYKPLDLAIRIATSAIVFDQLIHEYGRWVHFGIAKEGEQPRRQLLTYDAYGPRTGLLPLRP